jgi:DoxX-like family
MTAAYVAVTLTAIAANGFSGIAALLHFKPIMPGMAKAGVPVSWLTFPIGTLKTLGAVGLAAGLAFRPFGVSAAIGLVLFFVCAIYTHVRAGDYSSQFGLAIGFLSLNVAALALSLPSG